MDNVPKITAAQVVAIVGAVIGLAVAFGVDISQEQTNQIIGLVTILASVLIGGDAVVRASRNYRRGEEAKAGNVTKTKDKIV